jgi:hypothetical protein
MRHAKRRGTDLAEGLTRREIIFKEALTEGVNQKRLCEGTAFDLRESHDNI